MVNGTRRPTGGGIQIYFLHVDSNSFSHFFSGVRGLYIKSTFEKKREKNRQKRVECVQSISIICLDPLSFFVMGFQALTCSRNINNNYDTFSVPIPSLLSELLPRPVNSYDPIAIRITIHSRLTAVICPYPSLLPF